MQIDDESEVHEDRLLRYHWYMTKTGSTRLIDNRSIADEYSLKKFPLERHQELYQAIQTYLNTLGQSVLAYRDILRPDYFDAFSDARQDLRERIRTLSEKFVRLGASATFIPLLIAVRLKEKDQGETYLKVLELCEKYAFRVYAWNESQPRKGQSSVYWYTREYFNNRLNAKQLLVYLTNLTLRNCPDERFDARFQQPAVNWFAWKAIKYFLYEYELERANQRRLQVRMAWDDVIAPRRDTIEHILPQNPRKSYWKERFDQQTHDLWQHDIGNLTLTYFNGALSDLAFPDKRDGRPGHKECYARSLLIIEQDLVEYTDWTVDTIRERREKIRQWALKRWTISSPSAYVSTNISDETPNANATLGSNRNAIWASKGKRDPEVWLKSLAEDFGTLEEFCQILDAARAAGFYARMQNNWWVIKFTPNNNRNAGIFWLGPNLGIGVYTSDIEKYLHIPETKTQELLGKRRTLQVQEVPDLIAAIQTIAAIANDKGNN